LIRSIAEELESEFNIFPEFLKRYRLPGRGK